MPAESPDAARPGAGSDADDGAPTPEALEDGRRLFAQDCVFLAGAAEDEQLPDLGLPEVACLAADDRFSLVEGV